MRYSLRDLIALVVSSAVWLWVATNVSWFAVPILLAILSVGMHISAVRSLDQIKRATGNQGPRIFLGPVKSVHFGLSFCSILSVIGAALSLTGVLLRPTFQGEFGLELQGFPAFMYQLVTDRSFLGYVGSTISSQPPALADLTDLRLCASVGFTWSLVCFPCEFYFWQLVRVRWCIPVLAIAQDGFLVCGNPWQNRVDFLPWSSVEFIGETKLYLRHCITIRTHDPKWLGAQVGWLRMWLWRFNRAIDGFDFYFWSAGWCGMDRKKLLQQLQCYVKRPELRSLLDGAWPDARIQKRYDYAKQLWGEAEQKTTT